MLRNNEKYCIYWCILKNINFFVTMKMKNGTSCFLNVTLKLVLVKFTYRKLFCSSNGIFANISSLNFFFDIHTAFV